MPQAIGSMPYRALMACGRHNSDRRYHPFE